MRIGLQIVFVLAVLPNWLLAAPPEMRSVFPPVAQPGKETRLQIVGKNLGPQSQLLVPFPATVSLENSGADVASFKLTPAKDARPGVYPVRVRTAEGVSNFTLFTVTDLPVVREVEPNGRLSEAQRIAWPCLIVGSIGGQGAPHPSRDVDMYRFSVKAGDRLTFVAESRRLGFTPDLLLRLRGPTGRELTWDDDAPGLGVDPRLDYTFAQAGEYILEVHLATFNYSGRNFSYLVKVGDFDYARSVLPLGGKRGDKVRLEVTGRDGKVSFLTAQVPTDPLNDEWYLPVPDHRGSLPLRLAAGNWPELLEDADSKGTQTVAWPVTVNGRIATPGEIDRFRLVVKPGQKVRARVDAFYHGSALNGVLRAYDPAGKLLAENNHRVGRMEMDPQLDFTVPDGVAEVTIALEDLFGRGGNEYVYRLTLEPGGFDFELTVAVVRPRDGMPPNDVLHLQPGKPATVPIRVVRRGHDGPIRITALNPPAGVIVEPADIPAGETTTKVTVTSTKRTGDALFELALVGEAHANDQLIRRQVLRNVHLAEPYNINLPWDWRLTRVPCFETK